jgi:hypothetical protein
VASDRPASHHAGPRRRTIRVARTGAASEAIGPVTRGLEVFVLTHGQFSLMDALVYLSQQTGPADLTVSTWTAGNEDLEYLAHLLTGGEFRSVRFLVDRSFITRQPAYCATLRRLFGDDCIRTSRTHAKFATIRNDRWDLAVRTSMNLNHNPRMENIEVSDDPALCDFLAAEVDRYFGTIGDGAFDGALLELPKPAVTAGQVTAKRLYPHQNPPPAVRP